MSESRDIWSAYQDKLRELRKHSIAGPLLAPLQLQAELIQAGLRRQAEFEQRVAGTLEPLAALMELARDAPATLRTQAKAFEAASVSFRQVAEVLNLQAELLERTATALSVPAGLVRGLRAPAPDGGGD